MIYLDSCAIVKLTRREAETDALRRWIAGNAEPLVTSALARTECARALARSEPAALQTLPRVLAVLHQKPVTDRVLDVAAALPDAMLRSLDAIHIATAEEFGNALTWFVTYDKRLSGAGQARGLPTISPN